jgi:glycosyltransferase involved in cell wall biosynthesis
MNILHINTNDVGGAANAAIRIHKALLENKVDSNFLVINKSRKVDKLLSLKETYFKSTVFKKIERKISEYLFFQKNAKLFVNRDKKYEIFTSPHSPYNIFESKQYKNADIIHLHWISGSIDFFEFFKHNKKPVVWTLHDMNPFTAGCHYSTGCINYTKNCSNCPQIDNKNYDTSRILNKKIKVISKINQSKLVIITPSLWLKYLSKNSSLFGNIKHYRIPNCIDINIFKPLNKSNCRLALSLPKNKILMLFLSDDISKERKGFKILLEAIKNLEARINLDNVELVVLGSSNNQDYNIITKVNYLGSFSDEVSLSLVYNACDVFIMPSIEDNFPNTVMESQSCGVPVIGFNKTGVADMITHNTDGYLCESIDDINEYTISLSNAIEAFVLGKINFNHETVKQSAQMKYNATDVTSKYLETYKEILNETS